MTASIIKKSDISLDAQQMSLQAPGSATPNAPPSSCQQLNDMIKSLLASPDFQSVPQNLEKELVENMKALRSFIASKNNRFGRLPYVLFQNIIKFLIDVPCELNYKTDVLKMNRAFGKLATLNVFWSEEVRRFRKVAALVSIAKVSYTAPNEVKFKSKPSQMLFNEIGSRIQAVNFMTQDLTRATPQQIRTWATNAKTRFPQVRSFILPQMKLTLKAGEALRPLEAVTLYAHTALCTGGTLDGIQNLPTVRNIVIDTDRISLSSYEKDTWSTEQEIREMDAEIGEGYKNCAVLMKKVDSLHAISLSSQDIAKLISPRLESCTLGGQLLSFEKREEFFKLFGTCHNLRHLELSFKPSSSQQKLPLFTEDSVRHLSILTELKHLCITVRGEGKLEDIKVYLKNNVLQMLVQQHPKLEDLAFEPINLEEGALVEFQKCQYLRSLHVSFPGTFSTNTCKQLSALSQLKRISLQFPTHKVSRSDAELLSSLSSVGLLKFYGRLTVQTLRLLSLPKTGTMVKPDVKDFFTQLQRTLPNCRIIVGHNNLSDLLKEESKENDGSGQGEIPEQLINMMRAMSLYND